MRGARALLWVSLFAAGLLAVTAANEAQTHTVHSLKNWPLRLPGSLLEKAGGARRRVSVSNSTASDGLRDQDKGKKGRKHETEPPLTDEIRAKLTDKKYCKTLPYCTGDHQECRFSNTSFGPAFRKRSVLDALRFFVKTKYYDPKQFFAYGGTLIGIKRDGKFIPWDKDGDLGVTWTHWKRVMSQTGGKNVKYGPQGRFLLSMQCRLMDIQGRLIDSKTGYYVDIFTFFNSDNWKEVTDPEVNKQIPKDYSIGKDELFNPFPWPKESLKCRMFPKSALFPLKPCKFEGIELACPADSEKVLSACYEDWRVPSPPESWKGPVPPANSTMIAKLK